jgi:hypothetical protein
LLRCPNETLLFRATIQHKNVGACFMFNEAPGKETTTALAVKLESQEEHPLFSTVKAGIRGQGRAASNVGTLFPRLT